MRILQDSYFKKQIYKEILITAIMKFVEMHTRTLYQSPLHTSRFHQQLSQLPPAFAGQRPGAPEHSPAPLQPAGSYGSRRPPQPQPVPGPPFSLHFPPESLGPLLCVIGLLLQNLNLGFRRLDGGDPGHGAHPAPGPTQLPASSARCSPTILPKTSIFR